MSNIHKLKLNGKDHEIFMSFGLLDEITGLVGDMEQLPLLTLDRDTRSKMLELLLSERDEDGAIKTKFNPRKSDLTPEQINELGAWVSEHVLNFFLTALEGSATLGEKNKDRVQKLAEIAVRNSTALPAGSKASA